MNETNIKARSISYVLLILSVTALFSTSLSAQTNCSTADITLSSQADVANFQTNYGGGGTCDTVTGNLTISGADITDLTPLSGLTSIGSLSIFLNTSLANVDGLSSLSNVTDNLYISQNAVLTNVDGLSALTSVGLGLSFSSNPLLSNLDGLSALTSADVIDIALNDSLSNIDGLSNLNSVGFVTVTYNNNLLNLDGFSGLTGTGRTLRITNNPFLNDIGGLSGITSVGSRLDIRENASLTNLDALLSLISVGIDVQLSNNPLLESCGGLAPLLDDVDDGLPGPGPGAAGIPDVGGDVFMSNNLPGCNSVVEALLAEPSEGTAIVGVRKVFVDGNNETAVTVTLECASGTYAPDFAILQPGGDLEHLFVVDAIPDGVVNPCTVVEAPVDGYSPFYICNPESSLSEVDGDVCELKAGIDEIDPRLFVNDTTACGWLDVQTGDSNLCYIANIPDPVDVDVTKVWDLTAAGRNDYDTDVRITLFCDARIVGGDFIPNSGGLWRRSRFLNDDDYLDEEGEYIGEGTAEFEVIPEWFRTALNPENQRYTECWAEENASNDDAVLVDNDCVDLELAIGMGASCTITNTVFYEGIPTLNHYGMAIMALLMLGLGFVGMRRFV